ncbi:MAG: hypothetical protein HYV07_16360 [Deltaproteobacteria bacterium]|nr:hypothetical protein [Deltaproteobacteria bacterium]
MSPRRLSILAALTGAAGLGSETLMLKMLDLAVGSAPLVSFVVVASFVLGAGFGAAFSARVRRPFLAESALAAYDLGWVLGFDAILELNGRLLAGIVPYLGPNVACAVLGAAYALPPAFLLGISFPAVAERSSDASWAYGRQAIGALVGVVVVELFAFPYAGVPGSLVLLAGLHLMSAGLMFGPAFVLERHRITAPALELIFAGAATGAFQGGWLLLAWLLFSPHWAVQPLVVATMILGIAIGTAIFRRIAVSEANLPAGRIHSDRAPRIAVSEASLAAGRTLAIAGVGMALSVFASLALARLPEPRSILEIGVELVLALGLGAIPIGAIFPAYAARLGGDRSRIGGALWSLSLGNTLGVLLAGGVLLRLFSASFVAALTAILVVVVAWSRSSSEAPRRLVVAALIVALAGACSALVFGGEAAFIQRLHRDGPVRIEALFRGGGEVSAIYRVESSNPERRLYQNGFTPIDLGRAAEVRLAFVGAAYAPNRSRALVLGAGSGQTAGAVARAYVRTDVVDIGETVPLLLERLDAESYGLLQRESVTYHAYDAVIAPNLLEPGYDLVILTVDPAFIATAAKLYTREYFREISRLLAPGGVFVFWADATIDAEGVQVLWNTAESVFPVQRRFLAFAGQPNRREVGYHFIVSSAAPLVFDRSRPAARTIAGLDAATARGASLLGDERTQLLAPGRLHPTRAVHTRARPAPKIVLGGYSRVLYDVESEAR